MYQEMVLVMVVGDRSPGAGFTRMGQSNLTVQQMFGRPSIFTPGHEGNTISRGGSTHAFNFGNRTSSSKSSPVFQPPISRVLSVYILPMPTPSGNSVFVPTSVSKLRRLMDHHGCFINLQDAAGDSPAWDNVDVRVRQAFSTRKEEGANGLINSTSDCFSFSHFRTFRVERPH